jgi:TonB family protein
MKSRDNLTSPTTSPVAPADQWATALIQRAARRSPPELAERLEEEWLADLAEQPGTLSRLRFALGCCWARQVISYDPASFGVTAQRAVAGQSTLAAFASHDVSFGSRRPLLLLLIIAMHGVVIYGFSNGLSHRVFEALTPDIEATFFDEIPQPEPAPQPIQPNTNHWTGNHRDFADVIPVLVDPIVIPVDSPQPTHFPVATASPPDDTPVVRRVLGGPGSGFPSTADFYPPLSRQLGEKGAAVLQVCVDTHGRLIKDPEIKDSSGSARLDAGALALAKAGAGHYRSTTEDGLPVTSCYGFRVRFQLKE